jgi:hypothetical protein
MHPDADSGRLTLTADVPGASDEWGTEFNARAKVRLLRGEYQGAWGAVFYADGNVIVDGLRPGDLQAVEAYLARISPH